MIFTIYTINILVVIIYNTESTVLEHMLVEKLHHVGDRRSFVAFQPTSDGDKEVAMPSGAAMALSKRARQQVAVVARLQQAAREPQRQLFSAVAQTLH